MSQFMQYSALMTHHKYPEWGTYLKQKREAKYRSAREFCTRAGLKISYPQYSRYEAGDQLPSLEQAVELFRLLNIPVLEGILEWSKVQVLDPVSRAEVEGCLQKVRTGDSHNLQRSAETSNSVGKPSQGGGLTVSLDDIIIFNRGHIKAFEANPQLRDIFVYVNSYSPDWISIDELAHALEVTYPEMEKMLRELQDFGMVVTRGKKFRASKNNFYFPDDAEYFKIRNTNFLRTTQTVMKKLSPEILSKRQGFRSLISRELSSAQVEKLITKMNQLASEMVAFPENPVMGKVFSACFLVGEHFSRNLQAPGLRTEVDGENGSLFAIETLHPEL